jgi:hypothetical protein
LSISQRKAKKQATTTVIEVDLIENKSEQSVTSHNVLQFKPDYLKVPDHKFVRMLANATTNGDRIVQYLDTKEKVDFIRQMTELTNNLRYFDLQRQLWQYHYDLGLKEGRWGAQLLNNYAKQHNSCRAYGYLKHVIEKRQKSIMNQIHRTIGELQQYLLKLEEHARQWQPSFDANILSCAMDEYVKKGQQRFIEEFNYKKKMIVINSNDHYLIRSFYYLQPNEEQVSS